MQSIALISGLIGALASGALAFGVRMYLDSRALREAERRLAYVYFLAVNDFVAIDIVARAFAKAYELDKAAANMLRPSGADFELSHSVSAFIAEGLIKRADSDPKASLNTRATLRVLETALEGAKSVRLSAEQLSKLPRDAVYLSHRFQYEHQQLCLCVQLVAEILSSQDRSDVNPAWFQSQWMTVVRFAAAARELRAALVRFDVVTQAESADLLLKQARYYQAMFASQLEDKAKLERASLEAKKLLSELSAA